jgi:NitT/TauT family transport system permease protein
MSLTSSPDVIQARVFGIRRWRLNYEALILFVLIAAAWQVASHYYPPYLFPSLNLIARTTLAILTDGQALATIALTYARILLALTMSFGLALSVGIWGGIAPRVDRLLMPLAQLSQGVPALCWVIFATLWFSHIETRIAFVIVVSASPSFYYQIREGVRAIPRELSDMVTALRPSRWQIIRKLTLPWLVPQILAAWQLNLGAATKVAIMAELLSGISGIGYQLRLAQELFRMDRAIAWTLVLVGFVLGTNLIVSRLDRRWLKWRSP